MIEYIVDYNEITGEYHVTPAHEAEDHQLSRNCKCVPTVIDGYWVHEMTKEPDAITYLTSPYNIHLN